MIRFSRLRQILLCSLAIVTILTAGGIAYYYATLYTVDEAQEGYLALTGATVLAGEGLEPRHSTTILIRDGRIVEVGDDGDVEVPSRAKVLDLSGYTLMPGLIDLHVHMGPSDPVFEEEGVGGILATSKLVIDWARFYPGTRRAFLENGVTTVRDLGNEYVWIMELRRQLQDGSLEGPRLFAAGPIFTTQGGHPVATFGVDPASDSVRLPSTPEDARRAVREVASGENRVDLIKVVQERGGPGRSLEPIAPAVLDAIVAEAHEHDLPVTAHWGTLDDLKDVLAAEVDGLEHIESRGVLDGWPEDILDLLVEEEVPLSPTLAVTDAVLPPQVASKLRQRAGEFHSAGGRIVLGTDAPINGLPFGASVHRELELLVNGALTPQEALRAATSDAAGVLRTDRIGAVEAGRAADLVVVVGDPLRDIRDAKNVVMVFRDGRTVVDRRSKGERS